MHIYIYIYIYVRPAYLRHPVAADELAGEPVVLARDTVSPYNHTCNSRTYNILYCMFIVFSL